ncbi:hypothetical protein AKJ16_DCAP10512 [Drosera capensis]
MQMNCSTKCLTCSGLRSCSTLRYLAGSSLVEVPDTAHAHATAANAWEQPRRLSSEQAPTSIDFPQRRQRQGQPESTSSSRLQAMVYQREKYGDLDQTGMLSRILLEHFNKENEAQGVEYDCDLKGVRACGVTHPPDGFRLGTWLECTTIFDDFSFMEAV